ncbi:MAG: hypothetical protein WD638_04700, partial [Nitriliruptoraceae bacterium]
MSRRPGEHDPHLDLTDDARLAEEIATRAEGRSRAERAAEIATWAGTLHDLAERGIAAVVRLDGGRAYRGAIEAIGVDHVAVRTSGGTVALLLREAIRAVRPQPGLRAPVATGDRHRSVGRTLPEILLRLAEDGTRVALGLEGLDEPLTGRVLGLGEDVITLQVDAGDQGVVYLPT